MESVVVVGAGAAGVAVAEGLRRRGFAGSIAVVGQERARPYDRPPLSKQVLAGSWPPERATLLSDEREQGLGVAWHLGRRACSLQRERREVVLDDGESLGFDHLVIATGVMPRTLPAVDLTGVHVLRTLEDALAIRARLGTGARLAVIGGGFLGLETAATARALGAEVTVVEPLQHPLAQRLSHPVAARIVALHEQHGVRMMSGISVARLAADRDGPAFPFEESGAEPQAPRPVRAVHLTDGTILDVDLVLVAIGCRPAVDWLDDSGVMLDNGVVCDEYCSAGPGVWAAGDVARWLHPRLGRHVRLEHRMNANEQGLAVAKNILGAREPFAPIPFFWTDAYDVKVQVWGAIPDHADPILEPGDDIDADSFVVTFRDPDAGRLVGALGWNAMQWMPRYRAEIAATW
jgi:NADPH-dependent 2,4-dienoyl-CoA reductase/sulfur reductase-like enzyme